MVRTADEIRWKCELIEIVKREYEAGSPDSFSAGTIGSGRRTNNIHSSNRERVVGGVRDRSLKGGKELTIHHDPENSEDNGGQWNRQ